MSDSAQSHTPAHATSSILMGHADGVFTEGDGDILGLHGKRYKPDSATAYIVFRLAHSLPSVSTYGTALHPSVVARYHGTMLHKVFNFAHLMKNYDPENIPRDRILGTIIDVEFTGSAKDGEWAIPATVDEAPGIKCVAAIHKAAEGVDRIIGGQQASRVQWEVSMECQYRLIDSAFALPRDGAWEVVPWANADAELQGCYNTKKRSVDKDYQGVRPVLLMGGTTGPVQFVGVGLVSRGAERTNRVDLLLASDPRARRLTESANRWLAGIGSRFGLPVP